MATVLSTKKLLPNQQELLLNAGIAYVDYNAIQIVPLDFKLLKQPKNLIFTSRNAVNSYLKRYKSIDVPCFCVGPKTKKLLEAHKAQIKHYASDALSLAKSIVAIYAQLEFTFICSNRRRDDLPDYLSKNGVLIDEVKAYKTILNPKKFLQHFDAVLFYSPSGVQSFTQKNTCANCLAIAIGPTTAASLKNTCNTIHTANDTTVESVIAKAVKILKSHA